MITVRKSEDRRHFDYGWLDTYHTFSFSEFYDADYMGFRTLRVINEDFIEPGREFGMHPHRDMEIFTYILKGQLSHKDSEGNEAIIYPGDIQRMTAGKGVLHSESNGSQEDTTHLLQIWILPDKNGREPGYEQKTFSAPEKENKLRLILSPDGRDGSLTIYQDVQIFDSLLRQGKTISYEFSAERYGWVQLIRGEVDLNGLTLKAGDGASISEEKVISLKAIEDGELIFFNLS